MPELRAQQRVHAVGGNERVTRDDAAVGQLHLHPVRILGERGAGRAEMDAGRIQRAHGRDQHRVQVGAMQHQVRKAVLGDRGRSEVEQLPALARAPQPHLLAARDARHPHQCVFQSQRIEAAGRIGTELQSRADVAQHLRLLEHLHGKAAA